MLGRSSVEAVGLRFWRLTPFDVQHRDAVNLGLRTRVIMTPWASVEDDLEFAEHDKYSFQAGQAKVSEDWSHLLELNLHNVKTMKLGRDWATSLCSVFNVTVFSHARTLSCGRTMVWICQCVTAWSMPSTSSLVKADSCGCGTEKSRAVKGTSWVRARKIFSIILAKVEVNGKF